MVMRRLLVIAGVVIGSIGLLGAAGQQRDAETLFQSALYKEQVELKLQDAIAGYRDVVAAAGSNKAIAAKALLQMAGCYERLGDPAALTTYQRIVNQYGDSGEVAESARAKALALEQQAKGLVLEQVTDRGGRFISPDGRYLTGTDWNSGNIVVRDLRSGRDRLLTTEGEQPEGSYGQWPMPSPDGRLVAYHWFDRETENSELRVIGRDGGVPKIVYRNVEPSTRVNVPGTPMGWTPDSKSILAFLRTTSGDQQYREMFLIPTDGGPKKLVKRFDGADGVASGTARLSPDGRSVAFHRDSAWEADLVCLSVTTGRETVVVRHPADDEMLSWVPDSQRILFLSDRAGSWGLWAIGVVDCQPQGAPVLIRGNIGQIWAQGFTESGDFFFSGEGDSVARNEVYVANLEPSTGKLIGSLEPLGGRLVGNKGSAGWSPRGDQLAYLSTSQNALHIRTISDGSDRSFPLPFFNMHNPAWLPDGNGVVLQGSDRAGEDGMALHLVNTATGAVTSFPGVRGRRPVIASDSRMYFAGDQGIVVRDLESGAEQVVAPPVANLALSPDGRSLARLVNSDTGHRLSLIPSGGGTPRPLSPLVDSLTLQWNTLAWSADGRFIFVARRGVRDEPRLGEDTSQELWQVPVDGTEPTNTGIVWPGNIQRISVHPDGRRLAISASRNTSVTWVLRNIPGVRRK